MVWTAVALPESAAGQYTPQQWRQMDGGGFAHASDPITAVPGVLAGLDVTGLAGAQVQIGPGSCIVSPADGTRGSYRVSLDASDTLTLATPDATYSRIDTLVVRVYDAAFGDGSTQAVPEVVTGTPSVSPVAPAVPSGSLLLAYVSVPTSGAAAATGQPLLAAAAGGTLSGTRAQREALATTHLRLGQEFVEVTDAPAATPPGKAGQKWRWTGTEWVPTFICGYRAYIGQVMRPYNWDYQLAIPSGNVYALPLRDTHGAGFDERNNLDCTVVNGTNVQVPYSGRYRLRASVAADSATTAAEFVLAVRLNTNAAAGSPATNLGAIGGATPGTILDEQPKYMGIVATNAIHTIHTVEVPQYGLAAGDTLCVTLWQNSASTQQLRYENPHVCYLDVTRLGD